MMPAVPKGHNLKQKASPNSPNKLLQATKLNSPEVDNTVGVKYDSGKPDMSLLSSYAILELTKVLDFGAKKYANHNWRKGIAISRLVAAALRHMFAFLAGEDKDPETGLSHVAHAMCCCMFILELYQIKPELDDRFSSM